MLDDAAIHRFRERYREEFGATGTDDPLYESVSAGRRYVGMEHWLPLYYERLETLFDYLPGAGISLDHQADEVRGHRLDAIADFYGARRNVTTAARAGSPVYRPLRPDRLYLDEAEWRKALHGRPVVQVSPFAAPETDRNHSTPAPARCAISPPSAPTRRWRCSRRCATTSKPSANPAKDRNRRL